MTHAVYFIENHNEQLGGFDAVNKQWVGEIYHTHGYYLTKAEAEADIKECGLTDCKIVECEYMECEYAEILEEIKRWKK